MVENTEKNSYDKNKKTEKRRKTKMGIYLNPGNEGFQRAVQSKIYVDKTRLLEYINSVLDTEQAYMCVSRPRRFGKSITAEMLVAYYDKSCNSKKMFQNLKIAQNPEFEKYLNQYDVIHLDINSFRNQAASAKEAVLQIHRNVIEELKEIYTDCICHSDQNLPAVMAKINKVYHTKFIVIIDEWDALFRENREDEDAQRDYITLLRGLFKDAPSKRFIKLAYVTGILPIKKYGTESALNNFDEFTMIESDVLTEYAGFTESEVKNLYQQYQMDFEEAKRWYDGYCMSNGEHIYNPKSVVDSIRRKRIGNYWTNTETYESLRNYISMNYDGLKDDVIQMLAGGSCKINPYKFQNDMISFKSRDDILTLLIHLGYLTYDRIRQEVYIPNEEVRGEFKNAVEETGWDYAIQAIRDSDALLKATWQRDERAVAEGIDKVHMSNTAILTYNNENSLSCVISLAYYNAVNYYTLIREMPTGKGFADIVFLPRKNSDKPALVVELKWNQSADGAINQIKKREYIQALKEYHGNLLLVGVSYNTNTKEHECKIEEWKIL